MKTEEDMVQPGSAVSVSAASPERPACQPSLKQIADQVPLGWGCRSCGTSTYNALTRFADYLDTGKPCCPNFREWVEAAREGKPSVNDLHNARMAALYPERHKAPTDPLQRACADGSIKPGTTNNESSL